MDLGLVEGDSHSWGVVNPEYGRASMEYVKRAVELALEGKIEGLVTAPINKMAIKQAGYKFPGHTEYLAHLTNTHFYTMMLVGGVLRVVLVTRHLPLKEVSSRLSEELILRTIKLANDAGQMLGFEHPRIAVCGLNPHAGDGGVLGDEEESFIKPAITKAQQEGINAAGPLPPDTVFYKAYNGGFDFVVAMYHDQGLIPLKMLYFDEGVNVTLGLPIIRTSVDHGTAYDIAGQGIASEKSMVKAVEVAYSLAKGKSR